jgi:hypothetical protein
MNAYEHLVQKQQPTISGDSYIPEDDISHRLNGFDNICNV